MKIYYSIILLTVVIVQNSYGQKAKNEPFSYDDEIEFYWKTENDSLVLKAKNKLLIPTEIIIRERKTNNEVQSMLLKAKDSITIVSRVRNKPDTLIAKQFNKRLKIGYYYGHKSLINPDTTYQYRLPFQKGKKYAVSQGFRGKSSHSKTSSLYAIDFQLDIGEPVHAAREGLVVQVIDWYTEHGDRSYIKKANKIVVLHSDGTIASYVHLDYKGSFVKIGEYITKGQKIGTSGLTGFTRGPHLHFVVRKERDIAIPIYFEGYKKKELKRRKRYKVKN
ncbi:M23 family metallopeptidase [uncultured Psychroserpens sp.]|uniref:M23 family metallopeptidase n=1 Tax=uncultured Psychroserpens sp. TaxID=255436 RepID=UPI00262E44C3|nr:M23 family metallopeptidase [uncultured Psychroserpens sp.]